MLTVARDDRTADVDGWVTLTNGSGTSFTNASLQLVAGDLNRVREEFAKMADEAVSLRAAAAPAADDERGVLRVPPLLGRPKDDDQQRRNQADQHDDGHRRPREEALRRRRTVLLLPQRAEPRFADQGLGPGLLSAHERRSAPDLGWPCRQASCASISRTRAAACTSSGEDRIGHTPKDEVLNLRIGRAFDVVAERKQIDFEKIATNVYEVEYEVVLRNHKATPITVEVNEPIGGTWRVLRSTHTVHEDRRLRGPVHDPGRRRMERRV